jgi:hypothetical protein
MAKKRTTAQRRAAAKKAWLIRKANAALAKTNTFPLTLPEPAEVATPYEAPVRIVAAPKIGYAVKESDDIFICFGEDGSHRREKVSRELARKIYLDLAPLVL